MKKSEFIKYLNLKNILTCYFHILNKNDVLSSQSYRTFFKFKYFMNSLFFIFYFYFSFSQVLTAALRKFEGSVVVISHDRRFLEELEPTHVVTVRGGKVSEIRKDEQ